MKLNISNHPRAPGRPLQVYLDSSDYSDLSNAMIDPDHPYADIFKYLCDLVDQIKIEIRFSSVHVIEIAHLDAKSMDSALRRAKCLMRLSKRRCFKLWQEMQIKECINLLNKSATYKGLTNDNGYWCFNLEDLANDLKQTLQDEFEKMMEQLSLNRTQRRALGKNIFVDGKLTPRGMEMLMKQNRTELLESLSKEFPLSDRFYKEDLMLQYVTGKVGSKEIAKEFSIVFSDIERFIGWTYEKRDPEKKLVSWLRRLGGDNAELVNKMRDQVNDLLIRYQHVGASKDKLMNMITKEFENRVYEIRNERLDEIRSKVEKSFPDTIFSNDQWACLKNTTLGSIPSMDTHLAVYYEFFRRNLLMDRKLKKSDTADLFHLIHLPYCDIFRADGDSSETAKIISSTYRTIVVSKLRNLHHHINEVLAVRG